MSETRAAPLYCPYCGDEDLRPHEHASGAWECRSCVRVFAVRLVGLLVPGGSTSSDAAATRSGVTGSATAGSATAGSATAGSAASGSGVTGSGLAVAS